MDAVLFGKSLLLGLAIAAPLGPIGALCINRTLEHGFWAGMMGGVGTATADAVYAALAALGFAAFAAVLGMIDTPLRLVGGLFMIWLGVASLRPRAPVQAARLDGRSLVGTVAATFALTIANPATIISFAAIFAGLGLGTESSGGGALVVTAGVFLGSLAWWLVLSGGVAIVRQRLPAGFATWTSRLSGVVLIGFGLVAIGSLLLR